MPTIGDVITACQRGTEEPKDPDWSARLPGMKGSGLFIPRYRPHLYAVWEVIELYAQGLNLTNVAKKVGITRDTAMAWMERAGVPRRSAGTARALSGHRNRELARQVTAKLREREVES